MAAHSPSGAILLTNGWDYPCFYLYTMIPTSLRWRWQTCATRCIAPIMLYADVDGQYNKLATDDRHQFITLTVHLSWQHLRRPTWQLYYLQPFQRYGWCPLKFKCSRDLTTPLSGWFATRGLALATISLSTKFKVSISTHHGNVTGDTKCRKQGGWGSHKVTGNSTIR